MSGINIQNILDQLSTLAGAADSTQSVTYLSDLSNAVLQANNLTGVIEYPSKKELPIPVDSSALGRVYYVPPRADLTYTDSGGYDSGGGVDIYGAFYYAKQLSDLDSGYERIRTTKDAGPATTSTYSFQGSVSGYTAGGDNSSPSPPWYNIIDKFSFTSDGNATDVGDLTRNAGHGCAGQTSSTHGYVVGGRSLTSSPDTNIIEKYPFSVDGNATDVGDLTTVARYTTAQSSANHGYRSSDYSNGGVIDKHTFSVDANATDVGDLSVSRWGGNGQSSETHGYYSSGNTSANTIDKFSFSVDGNATDVGDMTHSQYLGSGQSSSTHGYNAGGYPGTNVIEKFPFSSDDNSTDVGDMVVSKGLRAGQSSTSHGYASGGHPGAPGSVKPIDKFSFTSDGNATDVGDLTSQRAAMAGSQV